MQAQGKLAEAEPFFFRALEGLKRTLGTYYNRRNAIKKGHCRRKH